MHDATPPLDAEVAPSRLAQVRASDEEGAQAVEYAMIGGVGAALISLLWAILERTNVLDKVMSAIVDGLIELVTGWF